MKQNLTDILELPKEEDKASTNISNIDGTNTIIQGSHNNVTNHNNNYHYNEKQDKSAEEQGRSPEHTRNVGDLINPMHMTPKEFKNYKNGLWDGIERFKNKYSYEPWDFIKNALMFPNDRRDGCLQNEEEAYSQGYKRRASDKNNEKFFYGMLIIMLFIIMFFVLGSVIVSGVLK